MTSLPVSSIGQNGRLLYTLLDAADESRVLFGSPNALRWQEAKKRIFRSGDYDSEGALFCQILSDLDSSGALSDTWIGQRWQTLKVNLTGIN